MNKETYKTKHKDIPYVTIGDKFVTNDGSILEFVDTNAEDYGYDKTYPFIFRTINTNNADYYANLEDYSIKLTIYETISKIQDSDIKCRLIPLKDKLNQI